MGSWDLPDLGGMRVFDGLIATGAPPFGGSHGGRLGRRYGVCSRVGRVSWVQLGDLW